MTARETCGHDDSLRLVGRHGVIARCEACRDRVQLEFLPAPGIGRRFVMERVDDRLVHVGLRASHDGLNGCATIIEEFVRHLGGWRRQMCVRPNAHDGEHRYRPLDLMYQLDQRKLRAEPAP